MADVTATEEGVAALLEDGPLSPPAEERAAPVLNAALRREYEELLRTCQVKPERLALADRIVDRLVGEQRTYASLETAIGTPWFVPAVIHSMESGGRFDRHLHNGDPLTGRTVRVPPGRPLRGNPPFTWVQSALDALQLKQFDRWEDWSVAGVMFKLEQYNGWGYRWFHLDEVGQTPYLWSFSQHYRRGRYVQDGKFDPQSVSQQCGAGVLLRRMVDRGLIPEWAPRPAGPILRYSGGTVIPFGAELQRFLNTLPDVRLDDDGKLGPRTSDAFRVATGYLLVGDPRLPQQEEALDLAAPEGAQPEADCGAAAEQVLGLAGQDAALPEVVDDGGETALVGAFMKRGGGWGGSEAPVRRAIELAKPNGLRVTSLKRSWGSARSDHNNGQEGSFAADLSNGSSPTPEMDRTAQQIAAAVGVPAWKGGVLEKFEGGLRLQLIWRWTGHHNHVHVGVRSLDTEVFDESKAPTLRRGDRGKWVWFLQYKLTMLSIGHPELDPGNADGDFGPRTEAVVKVFQTRAGLDPDGVAGRNTWNAMR